MFRSIKNRKNYLKAADVANLPISYENKLSVKLFNQEVLVEKNPWLWHLHLKITNKCNAKCKFCVEQSSNCEENAELYIQRVDAMLTEMEKANILYSVSVTGGEPTLFSKFKELCDVFKKHNIKFLTMNTNGIFVKKYISEIDGLFDFINISRHSINDEKNMDIFSTETIPTLKELKNIMSNLLRTQMRIQCVMYDIDSLDKFKEFVDKYSFANDLSFRRLMNLPDEYGIQYDTHDDVYNKILEYAFENYSFKEQTIQDYYVYEIYNNGKTDITFSYSNMDMLSAIEKTEDERVCREFIIHPNGTISGSWILGNKTILK